MNENDKDMNDATRGAGNPPRRVGAEQGHVRQSFSHGRSKSVVVEHVGKRKPRAGGGAPGAAPAGAAPAASGGPSRRPGDAPRRPPQGRSGAPNRTGQPTLSDEESDRRARALEAAKRAAVLQREQAAVAAVAARKAEEAAVEEAARAAVESQRKAAEEAAARLVAEAQRKAAEEAARAAEEAARAAAPPPPPPPPPVQAEPAFAPRAEAPVARAPQGERPYGDRPPYQDRGPRPAGDRPYGDRPPYQDRGPRPAGDRPPYGDRPPRPAGDRPYGDRPPRPAGDRPYGDRPPYQDRGPRPAGDRPPYGDRPPRPAGDRPYGDRPPRPAGDRPFGDRPPRQDGDRPYGDRPPRPAGDRPYGDRPPRPAGDRPFGDRPYGDRPPRPAGDRPGGFGDRGPRPAGDLSHLTPRLPGPKFISRAADRPEVPGLGGRADMASKFAKAPPVKSKAELERERADKASPRSKGESDRRQGNFSLDRAIAGEEGGRQRSMAAMRRRQERERRKGATMEKPAKVMREVRIPDAITVQELANRMAERGVDVIKSLMKMGMMATITQAIDADTAQIIVEEFGHTPLRVSDAAVEEGIEGEVDVAEALLPRAPVVTIMGHVDHGKTSLLDALRKTNVVSGEAGGITQHIGAYQVRTGGGVVTFLDTPGHAAFTSMRARGASVTDIVVLVVAADDSVMPQTIEAINHAKAASVPMIVAINKIDKPAANAQKVREELLRYEVLVEEMGGETLNVEVSAKTGKGLDKLVETILLQAEVLDLRANPDRAADGAVIEAKLDVGRGPVATVLVQRGTLRVGDIFVVGDQWGKVRALINDRGERVDSAGPSEPVEVLGLNGAPEAGDKLQVVENETRAREISSYRQDKTRETAAVKGARVSLDQLLAQAGSSANVKELAVIVKSDVQGSAEAIAQALEKIGNDEVRVRVLQSGVGAITESDVTMAVASRAPIIGFNVRANSAARDAATQKGVEIRYYSIIYDIVDDVKKAASGLLSPELRETIIGNAQILEVFKISNVGAVAGCRVTDGVARRSAGVRLLRDNTVIHTGKLSTLKRFKDEVKEVQSGQECGMAFENYQDLRQGDVIEIFETQTIERSL
ncbi:MAG: translation initiation factor IF-2 [Neomegalonema sp.]|nr:translation initiation factor IF-2 [Neomegalonema sp.]MDD2869422.1 translation initiation factor IF-2 [Neomegalonema sp.]